MMSSRGMGAISPNKMPGPKRKQRRDDTAFYEYAEGGKVSRVNEAGNYTKPGMRKALFNKIKGQAVIVERFILVNLIKMDKQSLQLALRIMD